MIDALNETVCPFSRAARRLPSLRGGRPVSPATLWRWARNGATALDGSTVRLETIRIGGTTCTSMEALSRFFIRLSGGAPAALSPEHVVAAKVGSPASKMLDKARI